MSFQVLQYISGKFTPDKIDSEGVMTELVRMVKSSSRQAHRIFADDVYQDIASDTYMYLLEMEKSGKFPLTDQDVFKKIKRLIYNQGDSQNREMCNENMESWNITSDSVDKVLIQDDLKLKYNISSSSALPDVIKSAYSQAIITLDLDSLNDLSNNHKNTLLGKLVLAQSLRSSEPDINNKDILSPEVIEVYLACLVVKLHSPWPWSAYLLHGNRLFISAMSIMSDVLIPRYQSYFEGVFKSARIFSFIRKKQRGVLSEDSLKEAMYEASAHWGIRYRDINNKYNKILRVWEAYTFISKFYADQIDYEFKQFISGYDPQLLLF